MQPGGRVWQGQLVPTRAHSPSRWYTLIVRVICCMVCYVVVDPENVFFYQASQRRRKQGEILKGEESKNAHND